jgi:hypothetical protein
MSTTGTVALRLAIALGIGLLIGTERESRLIPDSHPSDGTAKTKDWAGC